MNNPPAGRQPPSFKTNVNRAKTKRWVEAKSYSYDGDDWGEVDDYDEYGGYDEPPAPSRPTGLRQQGQSAIQAPPGAYTNRQDIYQSPVDDSQQGHRHASGPTSAQLQYGDEGTFHRSQSFNRGDERRAFSAGGAQQVAAAQGSGPSSHSQISQAQAHATRFSQIEGINQSHHIPSSSDYPPGQQYPNQPGPPRPPLQVQSRLSMDDPSRNIDQAYSAGGNYRGVSYSDQPQQTSMGSRTQSMTSNISLQDFHNRRDFTPSALPPPLQTRGSPSPQSTSDSQTSVRRPPRKDSLSQHGPANPPPMDHSSFIPNQMDRDDDSPLRERAGSNTSKPLPFVRPADIYRRMQEEKEKERQSQESSRPSMDVIMGQEAAPVSAHADRSSVVSIGRGPLHRSSYEVLNDGDGTQRLKPTLDPVKERKSEYGFEGFSVDDYAKGPQELPLTSTSDKMAIPAAQPSREAISTPMLPDVTRMSGFGESLLDTLRPEAPQLAETEESTKQLSPQTPKPESSNTDLQHQPSVGFRSVVNQAFDTQDDQIPPTPSSTADSIVGRSASGGTSVVSPINISRMPSAAAPTGDASEAVVRPMTPTLTHVQSGDDDSKPLSLDSVGTPRQTTSNALPSQSNRPSSTDSKATPFKPGHRRDLSTPSPDNSPARTPTLGSTVYLRQPQEVELATATPIEPNFPTSLKLQNNEAIPSQQPDPAPSTGPRASGTEPVKQQSIVTNAPSLPPDVSRRSRPDSPGSNRVRDLAEKFESRSSSPHGSEGSLHQRGNVSAAPSQNDAVVEPRPAADRLESFRPRLPGGWDSFASNAPSVAPNRQEPLTMRESREEDTITNMSRKTQLDSTPPAAQNNPDGNRTFTPRPDDQSISMSSVPDAISDPFSAMAAAGTALAGAFAAAVGMEDEDSAGPTSEGPQARDQFQDFPKDSQIRSQSSTVTANTEFHPDASKPLPLIMDDEQASSVAPTPLSRDTPRSQDETAESPEYFPPIVPLRPRPGSYTNTDETAAGHQRPPMPPSLSTDTGSQFESDRLRREIVKNLDPAQSSEPTTAESESPWQDDSRLSANPSLIRQGHDSGVLPSEYDSYWNGSSTASSSRTNSAHDHIGAAVAVQRHDGAALVGITSPLNISSDRRNQQPEETGESKALPGRPVIPHRFSWEQSQEDIPGAPGQNAHEDLALHAPTSAPPPLGNQNTANLVELPNRGANNDSTFVNGRGIPQGLLVADREGSDPSTEAQRSGITKIADTRNIIETAPEGVSDISTPKRTSPTPSPNLSDGLEVAGPRVAQPQADSRVLQYPDQIEHQDFAISQQGNAQISESPSQLTATRSGQDGDLPPLPPPSAQPKLRGFREMLALKAPTDRIQAFNETREQFAYLNTGLAHWLDVKTQELPEHAHLLSNQGRFAPGALGHKASPSRSKILGLRASGSPSTQQPYYQQYLNASSQPTAHDGSPASNHQGSVSSQGFSPSGGGSGKLSSQQVQAKGKDLLHTAGVFGGKANVAAKGLFSKGRSKLKGSSGTDKVDK